MQLKARLSRPATRSARSSHGSRSSVSALAAALVLAVAAAFAVPGPGWLPAALLLPSLAVCAFALAAATVVDPRASAVMAGVLWVLPVLWLATDNVPLLIVQRNA